MYLEKSDLRNWYTYSGASGPHGQGLCADIIGDNVEGSVNTTDTRKHQVSGKSLCSLRESYRTQIWRAGLCSCLSCELLTALGSLADVA